MKEDAVRSALTDDMLKHDIGIKKAIDLIVDSSKQDAKAKEEKSDTDKKDSSEK